MREVNIDEIRIDGDTQGRVVIDQPTVYSYLERMKEGDDFPLVDAVFDGTTYWLWDGFHRYHAYKLMGMKTIAIKYKPGTLQDAQVLSFGANGKHGKPRTIEDRRKVVLAALAHELTKDKSNREIARICDVSHPFVASVRNPEAKKEKQKPSDKPVDKPSDEKEPKVEIFPQAPEEPRGTDGSEPSREEIEAAEAAIQADQDMMYKLLEADEPLALAVEENKRLNLRLAQMEARMHGLMNEKNEAIKMVKKLQKELDKLKGKK